MSKLAAAPVAEQRLVEFDGIIRKDVLEMLERDPNNKFAIQLFRQKTGVNGLDGVAFDGALTRGDWHNYFSNFHMLKLKQGTAGLCYFDDIWVYAQYELADGVKVKSKAEINTMLREVTIVPVPGQDGKFTFAGPNFKSFHTDANGEDLIFEILADLNDESPTGKAESTKPKRAEVQE